MEETKVAEEGPAPSEPHNTNPTQRKSTRMTRKLEQDDFVYVSTKRSRNNKECAAEAEKIMATSGLVAEGAKSEGVSHKSLAMEELEEELKIELGEDDLELVIKEEDPEGITDALRYFRIATNKRSTVGGVSNEVTIGQKRTPVLKLVKLSHTEINKWMQTSQTGKKNKTSVSGIVEKFTREVAGEDCVVECVLCGQRVDASKAMFHLSTKCNKSPLLTCVTYNCPVCCCSFTNHSLFLNHFRHHSKQFLMADAPDLLRCEVCTKINCKGITELDLKSPACNPTLVCEICQIELASAADYVEHKKSHWTGEYSLQCEHCSKKYRNKSDLKYHLLSHHSSTFQFNCVKCGIGLSTRQEVKQHKCLARNPISTAQISVLNRVKIQRMKNKVNEPHTVVVFEDKEALFVSKEGGKKIFKVDEITEGDKEVAVDDASAVEPKEEPVDGLDTLADAASKHQNSCEFCGKTFATSSGRHKHLKLMHGYKRVARAKGPSSCCFCEKVFKSVYHLKEHIRALHTDDKQFECDVCQKRYRTIKDCNYHKQTVHMGIFRYYCAKCGRGLHSLARLNRHNCNWKRREPNANGKKAKKEEKQDQQLLTDVAAEAKSNLAICRSWNKSRLVEEVKSLPREVLVTGVSGEKKEVSFVVTPSDE